MSIEDTNREQEKIIREIPPEEEWTERYKYIIRQGNALENIGEDIRSNENKIGGCQSPVWVSVVNQGGKMIISADSDAKIVRGVLALILRVFNNRDAGDIIDTKLYFMEKTGLSKSLSPARARGAESVIEHIKKACGKA